MTCNKLKKSLHMLICIEPDLNISFHCISVFCVTDAGRLWFWAMAGHLLGAMPMPWPVPTSQVSIEQTPRNKLNILCPLPGLKLILIVSVTMLISPRNFVTMICSKLNQSLYVLKCTESYLNISFHCIFVFCVTDAGRPWFGQWLVTYSVPCPCHDQCRLATFLRNRYQEIYLAFCVHWIALKLILIVSLTMLISPRNTVIMICNKLN